MHLSFHGKQGQNNMRINDAEMRIIMKTYRKRVLQHHGKTALLVLIVFLMISAPIRAYAKDNTEKPYFIKVNRVYNTITVYENGETGRYDHPIKAMACSVGRKENETPLGTYSIKDKARWKLLMGDVWGQYTSRINKGVLFHSVYYYENGNHESLAVSEYNRLGNAASHGCIRLSVGDAKWIYDNCASGTTVVIYDDKKSAGPLGKPETMKIPLAVRWDPTDPDRNNPYNAKKPVITGAKSFSVPWGSKVNLRKGVKAKSSVGADLTSKLIVNGSVNTYMAGKYTVTYSVTDSLGRQTKDSILVNVMESKRKPVFKGIKDVVTGKDTIVDKKYAMENVSAYCNGIALTKKDIQVSIKKLNDAEYRINYSIRVGKKVSGNDHAIIHIDNVAPTFSGVADRVLQPGQIPDQSYALENVSVTDNYSKMSPGDITVTVTQSANGGFEAVYEAQDEYGNMATATAEFTY
jgi:hypothetical protein